MGDWQNRIVGEGTLPASDLVPHPQNWRKHPTSQGALLTDTLGGVGWVQRVIVNRRTGRMLDGHLRAELARKQGKDTPVPVLYVDLSEDEERTILATLDPVGAMAIADEATLAALVQGIGADDLRSVADSIAQTLGVGVVTEVTTDTEPQIDKVEELRQKWGVESGQMWQLGEHRLICGDCTDAAVVARVMGGERASTLIFDPEWDAIPAAIIGYDSVLAFCDGATVGKVAERYGAPTWLFVWDCVSSWYTPNRPLRRSKHCCWYGNINQYNFDGWHYGDSGEQRTVRNTRGEYMFIPDPRGKHLADVFSHPITQLHAGSEHNHSKPIDWICLLIANCTAGDVFDPYLGSGTTLIACENLGRRCRAVEISPGYVAVTLQRWADHTGQTPTLLDTGA